MNKEERLHSLLKLKKHETPGDAYFDAFVDEFHRYQRTEVLEGRKSWLFRWKRGVHEIMEDLLITPARLLQGSAAVFGVVLLSAVLLVGQFQNQSASEGLASHDGIYVDGTEFNSNSISNHAELIMAHLSSFEHDFEGSQYVTGGATLTHVSEISF
ncbi:MAG: hypothetical protein AAF649_10295 [Verrucomicrobiota bacterium]